MVASLGRVPQGWWDIGLTLEVEGRIVRDVRPAPYAGITLHYSDQPPEETILVRLTAPDDGCWTATLED
ncbi:MAG: hypothetical protein ACRDPX_03965, partial [Gaiellaceae bacterium]